MLVTTSVPKYKIVLRKTRELRKWVVLLILLTTSIISQVYPLEVTFLLFIEYLSHIAENM